jgi:hypothetical protein
MKRSTCLLRPYISYGALQSLGNQYFKRFWPLCSFTTTTPSPASDKAGAQQIDPFTNKLQQKIEEEILELTEKSRDRKTTTHQSKSSGSSSSDGDGSMSKELGGPKGPEPTRYGDWERGGRCSDF